MSFSNAYTIVFVLPYMASPKLPKIWLTTEGDIVSDHKIEAYSFGQIMMNLQKVLNVIHDAKYPGTKRKFYRLYLSDIQKNCVTSSFQASYSDKDLLTGEIVYNEISGIFEEVIQTLSDGGDMDDVKAILERELVEPSYIIQFLINFSKIISKKNYTNQISFGYEQPEKFIALPHKMENKIQKLIHHYTDIAIVEVAGIITGMSGEEPSNFTLKTVNNENIICYFPQELETDVYHHYMKPVKIRGTYRSKVRKKELDNITEFRSFNYYAVDEIDGYSLKVPILLMISYDRADRLWCLENDELALSGYGSTLVSALDNLKEGFDTLITGIMAFDDSEISEDSKHIKQNFEKHVVFDDFSHIISMIIRE